MKWKTDAKKGRFDAATGPFSLEVVEITPRNAKTDPHFAWGVLCEGVSIVIGQKCDADLACRAAEDALFEYCIDAIKDLRA